MECARRAGFLRRSLVRRCLKLGGVPSGEWFYCRWGMLTIFQQALMLTAVQTFHFPQYHNLIIIIPGGGADAGNDF